MAQNKTVYDKDVEIRGEIIQLYANCPKPSGWFGGKVRTKSDGIIRLSGICQEKVSNGLIIKAVCDIIDKGFGLEYEAKSVEICLDNNRALVNYLSGSNFQGVGHVSAQRIIDKYQKNAFDEIVKHPQKVQTECGLSDTQIQVLVKGLTQASRETKLLNAFPHLTATWVNHILANSHFKNRLNYEIGYIRKNPYDLLTWIDKIPFRIVDEVALYDIQMAWDDNRRLNYIFQKAFQSYMSLTGGTYVNLSDRHDADKLKEAVETLCRQNVTESFISAQLVRLSKAGKIKFESINQEIHVYWISMWQYEQDIVDLCKYHLNGGYLYKNYQKYFRSYKKHAKVVLNTIRNTGGQMLSIEQEEAILFTFDHSMSFITGGPGRGKTSLMKTLTQVWSVATGGHVVMLAPTGKAVNRIKESTGWNDVQTIARFLKSNLENENRKDGYCMTMSHSELELKPECLILIDESSMIPFADAAKILTLLKRCHIVFVGDNNQLPPIEPGPFLYTMLSSHVMPVYELKTNYRTKSVQLGVNADLILQGEMVKQEPSCFHLYPSDDEHAVKFAMETYQRYLQNGADLSDIMMMSPVNKGIGSVGDINQKIQDIVNPKRDMDMSKKHFDKHKDLYYMDQKGWAIPNAFSNGLQFRIFDRVMNTKNHADGLWSKYKYNDMSQKKLEQGFGYFNGDTGTIIRYYLGNNSDEPKIAILLDDNRIVTLELEEFHEWVFGYCITFHKSQGCEAPNCLLVLPSQLHQKWFRDVAFLNRNLLYTGITRASLNVDIFGDMSVLKECIQQPYVYHNVVLNQRLQAKIHALSQVTKLTKKD